MSTTLEQEQQLEKAIQRIAEVWPIRNAEEFEKLVWEPSIRTEAYGGYDVNELLLHYWILTICGSAQQAFEAVVIYMKYIHSQTYNQADFDLDLLDFCIASEARPQNFTTEELEKWQITPWDKLEFASRKKACDSNYRFK